MWKHTTWLVTAAAVLGTTAVSAADKAADKKPLGPSWSDVAKMPNFWEGMWGLTFPLVDGAVKVGYTEAAKAYIANYKPRGDLANGSVGCKTPGMPVVMRSSAPAKFMFAPGMIAIYLENASQTRFIHLNKERPKDANPTYLGLSRGHFEGDTLVIESTDFVDDIEFQYGVLPRTEGEVRSSVSPFDGVIFGPHGPNMRMVERLRLSDPNTLELKMTVYDDAVFTGPYVAETRYMKRMTGDRGTPMEWVCSFSEVNRYDPNTDEQVTLDPEQALKLLEKQK